MLLYKNSAQDVSKMKVLLMIENRLKTVKIGWMHLLIGEFEGVLIN